MPSSPQTATQASTAPAVPAQHPGERYGLRPPASEAGLAQLNQAARRHLWMHFTDLGSFADTEVPIIVRGDGPYVVDARGRRYLDGLSGLYTSQLGHTVPELAEAAARQMRELAYTPIWSRAHTPAIQLAELAGLYCRIDNRGEPVIQLAPPLICDQRHFDEIEQALRSALTTAVEAL
ncbi:aminotransferase class III-fold pyridoxal phosphate-dependent enzyme [Streptomyces sp. NPDC058287]|uniref:aminotransferase class III-fold pyridoxal phosphate-dependent enzyme n=1 Tax=unclassified Streptomyces TaxID=2593676 RepID=UPI0036F1792D